MNRQRRRARQGIALVLAALCLTLLIGFVGMAVDLGQFLASRAQLQAAADAVALAAAFDLPDEEKAREAAREAAELNGLPGDPQLSFVEGTVAVTFEKPSPAIFTGVFGLKQMEIRARSKAALREGSARLVE